MTRVPENAVQQALAGKGRKVTSLLKPVAWMFVIAALLIALDSAAGVGVLILLQHGIDSGVAAGDMSTIGLCALLALCPGHCGLVQLFSADGLRRQSGGISSAFGALAQLRPYAASWTPPGMKCMPIRV